MYSLMDPTKQQWKKALYLKAFVNEVLVLGVVEII